MRVNLSVSVSVYVHVCVSAGAEQLCRANFVNFALNSLTDADNAELSDLILRYVCVCVRLCV